MASVQLAAYQGRTAKLTVVESSYSITDNTSILTWTLEVLGGSSNYYNMYNLQAIVNGTTVYGPTTKEWSTKVFPAARGTKTGTVTIEHNPDGSHADVGFTLKGKVFNSGTETYNGTVSLTTIPRASSVSINSSNVTTNSSYTITVTPAVENTFSHILKYSFGNTSGTIASLNTSSTSYSWQIPRSLAAQIPNSTESSAGALVITCETYNGSTLVGSKTCSCKLIVDGGIVPSLSSSSIQDGNATVRGKSWGIYLQNMSYVNINTMSGSGSQGSSIASYWCTFEGTNYSSTSLSGLNSQIQARGLPTTGNRTLQLWVVDSRGRLSTKASKSYTVVAYSSPSINSYDAYRSNSSGTATDDGTYFRYALNCSISSCSNHNPMTIKIRWKVKGSSTDTGSSTIKNAVTTEASYNSNGTLGGGNIATNNSYEIIFEVSDAFSTISRSKDVGPAFELLHYHASGKAVAFGKKSGAGSSEELFEVNMPAKFYNGIQTQIQATANSTSSITGGNSAGRIKWLYNVSNGTSNLFPVSNNANAIMHINKHNGNYDSQLGFSSNGNMYYKSCNGTTLDSQSWKRIAFDSDIPSVPASTNYLQRYSWWDSGASHNANDLHGGTTFAYTSHNCPTTGTIVSFDCSSSNNYGLQLQGAYSGDRLFFRNRNGDNNTWRNWSELCNLSTLNSNLPTHGSNSNGHWLRFPNIKIQICWHTMDLTTSSSTSSVTTSGNVYYVDGTWTFPVAFSGNPVVSVTAIDRDTGVFAADINKNDSNPIGPTSCLVTAYGPAKSRKTGVQLIAIGTYS